MARLFAVIAMLAILATPFVASAQERLVLVQQEQQPYAEGVDPGRILAVGAGVIVGAVVGGMFLDFQGAGVVGAVAGGYIGDWWYGEGDDILTLEPLPQSY